MSTHLLDQGVFRPTLPEDVEWEPFSAFPPSARPAVVVGHPSEPAPYVVGAGVVGQCGDGVDGTRAPAPGIVRARPAVLSGDYEGQRITPYQPAVWTPPGRTPVKRDPRRAAIRSLLMTRLR
jgi:hypothetical protein